MKTIDYFSMRAYFFPREINNTVEFKLNELESLWYCTQKSVKRRLKQFAEEGRFLYHPGKGRGNHSVLTFKESFQEEIENEIDDLLEHDHLEDVVQIFQLPIPKNFAANAFKKVQDLFGLKTTTEAKDILRTIVTRRLTTLDPLYTSINFESFLLHQLGDTLVVYDQKKDLVQPHLAHNWEAEEDNKVWTFYLRKGVRFHNQQYMTSEDVKFTFDRIQSNSSPHSWLVEEIIDITCPSPYVVRFQLAVPNPFFLRFVSAHNLVILPRNEEFDEYKWVGTGPFQLKKRTNTLLVLDAFDDYFLTRPLIDEVQFYRVAFDPTRYVSYEIERKEVVSPLFHQLGIEVGFRFLAFNFKRQSIVHDASFRKAIFHLFDVRKIWEALGRGDVRESSSYFYWKSKQQKKDASLISSLVENSGYQGENVKLFTVGYPSYLEEAEWVKKEAHTHGINLQIETYTLDQYYSPLLEQADMLVGGEVASTDLHLSFIGAFLNKALVFNRFFSEEQLEILHTFFEKIKQEIDGDKRTILIEQVEDYIQQENLFLYLYHPIKKRVFHPMIKDIEFESYGYVDFRKLWIK